MSSTRTRLSLGPLAAALYAASVGCASPGPPRPPSLHLPHVVDDLAAERVAKSVRLHWTTPATTTDNLPAPANLTAVLCRQAPASGARTRMPCVEIKRVPVQPGASTVEDELPAELTSAPTRLLVYRVEILNAAGRGAGPSPEAYAAAGAAPEPVLALAGTAARDGARLHWTPGDAGASIELHREDLTLTPAAGHPKGRGVALPLASKPQRETRLRARAAGDTDVGGVLDRSARLGETYAYTAQRVRTSTVEGHVLEMRSAVSAPLRVEMTDSFAPDPPTELRAAGSSGPPSSIDLSWQPGGEADLAGYAIYRAEAPASAAGWRRLNAAPVSVPGYSDTTVTAGVRYMYRVTAVDTRGHESAPGNEVEETVPAP